ncbi:MAG: DegV family protein [Anaerolineae bacterium CFX3]|nr:DegV family protein [Anaerolineae bacterium CFX3]MCQ3946371.1 fatty acid-binding protein DegV [Anaerolineae bacterium]RIK27053.1 MAG: fatty acid-binding protein DegV [Anaerolineae bacterium]
MKIGVVTDSTSDLPGDLAQRFGVEVVPTILVVEGKQYADGKDLSRGDFYARLPAMRTFPTTAAPSIGEFSARYQKLLQAGCDFVLSIHAASQLTAVCDIARQAADDFPGRVAIVDSGSLSLGLGFQALAAAEAAESGADVETAIAFIADVRRRLRVFAALDTMDYLRRSGRVPAAVTLLGGMLSIKPLIELTDGLLKPAGATRTTRQADERMAALLKAGLPIERLAILHTGAESRARGFLSRLMEECRRELPREILVVNVATVIGAHVGPNGLGFAAVRAK